MINIIAAIGKNRELGKDNKLLWHIRDDLKRFKTLTLGQVVIMGRKTFESIGKPLPHRTNIVVTRNRSWTPLGCTVCHSLEKAIKNSEFRIQNSELGKEIFIIGGAEIYKQGMQYADKLYLTLVNKAYPSADVFFPDYTKFVKKVFEENRQDANYSYKFIELIK